jgi:hypothetical protein
MNPLSSFEVRQIRLADVCARLSFMAKAGSPKAAKELHRLSQVFRADEALHEKVEAAGELRRMRRSLEEGLLLDDVDAATWQSAVDEAFDLSTIYSELRFSCAQQKMPNQAVQPTPGSVTPRASEGTSK